MIGLVIKSVLIGSLVLMIYGCGDQYRYPCQDPKNWEKAECKPPVCDATGTCTQDVLDIEFKKQPLKGTK